MDRAAIERFHLYFCYRLSSKVDRNFFCLKGGCNLRFYFQSIRYSEDIDFDVRTVSLETLKKNVGQILDDTAFRAILKNNHKLEIVEWSAPKQTETTPRWKVTLKVNSQSLTLPTKIEFSRRNIKIEGAETQNVSTSIIQPYKLQPIILQHYILPKAIEQKMSALVNRSETQARDIIDLQFLKTQQREPMAWDLPALQKKKALETVMSVSFSDYKSQVWPYLMHEYQDYYEKEETWHEIQTDVIQFIQSMPESIL